MNGQRELDCKGMGPVRRYLLLQTPELILVAGLLGGAWQYGWLGAGVALAILAIWALKEIALYPLYRHAIGEGPVTGAAALEGRDAWTATALTPEGYIRVAGEYWAARMRDGSHIGPDTLVRVVASHGLVLIVAVGDNAAA